MDFAFYLHVFNIRFIHYIRRVWKREQIKFSFGFSKKFSTKIKNIKSCFARIAFHNANRPNAKKNIFRFYRHELAPFFSKSAGFTDDSNIGGLFLSHVTHQISDLIQNPDSSGLESQSVRKSMINSELVPNCFRNRFFCHLCISAGLEFCE